MAQTLDFNALPDGPAPTANAAPAASGGLDFNALPDTADQGGASQGALPMFQMPEHPHSPTPVNAMSLSSFANKLGDDDQNAQLQGQINTNNDQLSIQNGSDPNNSGGIMSAPSNVKSQSQIYGDIDNSPDAKLVQNWRDQHFGLGNKALFGLGGEGFVTRDLGTEHPGALNPLNTQEQPVTGIHGLAFDWPPVVSAPPEVIDAQNRVIAAKNAKYNDTGTDGPLGQRVQPSPGINPKYDPTKPPGPDNSYYTTTDYLVDTPDRTPGARMAYQVGQTVVGGIGDFLNDLKNKRMPSFSGEGPVGKALPETVPDSTTEGLATTLSTFFVGPKMLEFGGKMISDGIGAAAKAGGLDTQVAGLAAKFTPEVVGKIQQGYQDVIAKGGTPAQAAAVAETLTQKALAFGAFNVKEMIAAPLGSQGMTSPEMLQEHFGMTKERAQDLSMALDSGVVKVPLEIGSAIMRAGAAAAKNTFGALRNFSFGSKAIENLISHKMTDKEAGVSFYAMIDPNILNDDMSGSRQAQSVLNLSKLLQDHATEPAALGSASTNIKLDTTSAFNPVAETYFRTNYAWKEKAMGTDKFNSWVEDQAAKASTRMYKLRTGISSNGKTTEGMNALRDLYWQGGNEMAGGNLNQALGETSQAAADLHGQRLGAVQSTLDTGGNDYKQALAASDARHAGVTTQELGDQSVLNQALENSKGDTTNRINALKGTQNNIVGNAQQGIQDATDRVGVAQANVDAAKTAQSQGISNDPNFGTQLRDARDANGLGKGRAAEKLEGPAEDLYQKQKGDLKGIDDAYKQIGDSGAMGDPVSLLKLIKESPKADKLQGIAEEINKGGDFGNLYNNVRNQVNKRISIESRPGGDGALVPELQKLKKNLEVDQLDSLRANGDGDVAQMVQNAKDKYAKYQADWHNNNDALSNLAKSGEDRYGMENFPENADGTKQGVGPYRDDFQRNMETNLGKEDAGRFASALKTASGASADDISHNLVDYLHSKAVDNMLSGIDSGKPETIGLARDAIKNHYNTMQELQPNSPHLTNWQSLDNNLRNLQQNTKDATTDLGGVQAASAVDKERIGNQISTTKDQTQELTDKAKALQQETEKNIGSQIQTSKDNISASKDQQGVEKSIAQTHLDAVQKQADDMKDKAEKSIITNLLDKNSDRGPLVPKSPTDTAVAVEKMYGSHDAIQNVLKATEDMPPEQAKVARDALKGQFLRYMEKKLRSGSQLGNVEGTVPLRSAYRQNTGKADRFFQEDSNDLANMKTIFADDKPVLDQIDHVIELGARMSHKTPASNADAALKQVTRPEDPAEAMQSLITFTTGVLNPTSSRLRRLTAPYSQKSLEQLREAKSGLIENVMDDASKAAELGRNTVYGNGRKPGLLDDLNKRENWGRMTSAAGRTTSNEVNTGGDRLTPMDVEMQNLLKGVKK